MIGTILCLVGTLRALILTSDRKQLDQPADYFWWYAGLGSASGTIVFFFDRSLTEP